MDAVNEHENKALIRRWLEAADGGFPAHFDAFFVSGYRGHLSGRIHMDLAELVRLERGFAAGFTDVKRAIDDLLAMEDKVVLRLTTTAMHTGEFQGIAPTGRRVTFTGMVIYRIEEGRIAESWGEIDFGSLWRQLTTPSAN
jgi:predicted ester cyclase